jgi:hypothetical protein
MILSPYIQPVRPQKSTRLAEWIRRPHHQVQGSGGRRRAGRGEPWRRAGAVAHRDAEGGLWRAALRGRGRGDHPEEEIGLDAGPRSLCLTHEEASGQTRWPPFSFGGDWILKIGGGSGTIPLRFEKQRQVQAHSTHEQPHAGRLGHAAASGCDVQGVLQAGQE